MWVSVTVLSCLCSLLWTLCRVECVTSPKIIGGWHVTSKEAPYHAALVFRQKHCKVRKLARWIYICGGTIISEWWVLTAAHCITDLFVPRDQLIKPALSPQELAVVLGRDDRNYKRQWLEDIFLSVKQVIPHPEYKSSLTFRNNDIGLLGLERGPLVWGERIQPALLPPPNYFTPRFSQTCVAGFGLVSSQNRVIDKRLKAICGWLGNHEWCNEGARTPFINESVPFASVCWTYRRSNKYARLCNGDSGNGMTKKLANRSVLIIGVVAASSLDCMFGASTALFTHVPYFEPWIRSVIKEVPPGSE